MRDHGIGWKVRQEFGGSRIIDAAYQSQQFRGVVVFIVRGADLFVPIASAAEVVEALESADFGARIIE